MALVKKLWKAFLVISPVIIAFVGNWLATIFEIHFQIIPEDKWYALSLAVYSSALAALIKGADYLFINIGELKSVVRVEYSLNSGQYYDKKTLMCPFNSDIANVYAKISLNGKPDKFKDLQLKICFPIQVEIQKMKKSRQYFQILEAENSILIDLNNIYNTGKEKRFSDNVEIGFIAIKLDEIVDSSTETTLNEKRRFLTLEDSKVTFTK